MSKKIPGRPPACWPSPHRCQGGRQQFFTGLTRGFTDRVATLSRACLPAVGAAHGLLGRVRGHEEPARITLARFSASAMSFPQAPSMNTVSNDSDSAGGAQLFVELVEN
eukprot:7376666-Prymnesium_polylepis.4